MIYVVTVTRSEYWHLTLKYKMLEKWLRVQVTVISATWIPDTY